MKRKVLFLLLVCVLTSLAGRLCVCPGRAGLPGTDANACAPGPGRKDHFHTL